MPSGSPVEKKKKRPRSAEKQSSSSNVGTLSATHPPPPVQRRRIGSEGVPNDESASTAPPPPPATHSPDRGKPFHDPIYRIMHRLPRSDVLEIVKCKFGKEHCGRAVGYFDASFMQNPLRRLRLQIGSSGPGGLHLFFPRLFFHRFALRTLDLSRNKLSADDVVTLCNGLGLNGAPEKGNSPLGVGSSVSPEHNTSVLELLDLSYNLGVGNRGAVYLMNALRRNTTIRAVQLVSVSVDDVGAQELAPILRERPRPLANKDGTTSSVGYTQGYAAATEQRPYTFLLNLNHNVIGAAGTVALGKGLPSYVSVTLCKQRLKGSDNPAAKAAQTKRTPRRGKRPSSPPPGTRKQK